MDNDPKKKEVYEYRKCTGCDRKFYISVAEKEYFDSRQDETGKAFQLPKRCWPCRVKRREGQA